MVHTSIHLGQICRDRASLQYAGEILVSLFPAKNRTLQLRRKDQMGNNKSISDANLSLGDILIRIRETLDVVLNVTVVAQELNVGTVDLDLALLAKTDVLITAERSETPVLGNNDLLATRELVHRTAESLDGGRTVGVTSTDGHQDLTNVHTSHGAVGLAESTTHTGLETIGTGAGQHLVDTDDMVGVSTDTEMETFLSGDLDKVPVLY
jgi:hypothetical protein